MSARNETTVGGLLYSVLPFLACVLLYVLFSPTAGAIGNGFEYWGFRHRLTLALFSLSSGNIWLDAFSISCRLPQTRCKGYNLLHINDVLSG